MNSNGEGGLSWYWDFLFTGEWVLFGLLLVGGGLTLLTHGLAATL